MNYTTAQQSQLIEFYLQWTPHVDRFGYDNLPAGTHTYYRHGKKFFKEQQAAEAAAAKAKIRATRWTAEEYDAMAAAYINNAGDRPSILAEFRAFSERHTNNAIDIAAQACRALDTTVKTARGMTDFAQGLLDALNAIEPGRFKATR